MEVNLLETSTQNFIKGQLKPAKMEDMKTLADGWRFNWRKHFYLPNSKAFKIYANKIQMILPVYCFIRNYKIGSLIWPTLNVVTVINHDKYGAIRVDEQWMYIDPEKGNGLVEKFLINNIGYFK